MIRPAIDKEVTIFDEPRRHLLVTGETDPDPLPDFTRVFLEQERTTAGGEPAFGEAVRVQPEVSSSWQASIDTDKFTPGPAMAVGIEVRFNPISVLSWSQVVQIVQGD
jgi:hypothetical protein